MAVHTVCIHMWYVFSGGGTVDQAVEKIKMAAELIQCIIAEAMWKKFSEPKTFNLGLDSSEEIECNLFRIKLKTEDIERTDTKTFFWTLVNEILESELYSPCCKYLAVLSFTRCDPASGEILGCFNTAKGQVAVVQGGCLFSWPRSLSTVHTALLNNAAVQEFLYNDSGNRSNYGGCFATSLEMKRCADDKIDVLGACLHELSHTFDLIHDSKGVMANGFNNVQSIFLVDEKQNSCSYGQNDSCTFDVASLILLYHNEWLNDEPPQMVTGVKHDAPYLSADSSTVISKSNPILMVEVISIDGDKRMGFWDLRRYGPEFWFIPCATVKKSLHDNVACLRVLTTDRKLHILPSC